MVSGLFRENDGCGACSKSGSQVIQSDIWWQKSDCPKISFKKSWSVKIFKDMLCSSNSGFGEVVNGGFW